MTTWKCHVGRLIQRAAFAVPVLVLLDARTAGAQTAILPRDAAVREYELGLESLKKKDFRAAIERLNSALATGHNRVAERFGTSRYQLEWYDPYYWLGVAQMELGLDAEARRNLLLSKEGGVIQRRPEYADLADRLRLLEERAAAARAPAPVPTSSPAPAPAAPPLPSSIAAERFARPEPAATVLPAVEARTPPHGGMASSVPLIQAIAEGRFDDAEVELGRLRARSPEAAEPELLAAVLFASRYVLEGSADADLLLKARKSLETFRRRGGSRRAEEAWLSPSLRALLAG